jgi:hypothetical protein
MRAPAPRTTTAAARLAAPQSPCGSAPSHILGAWLSHPRPSSDLRTTRPSSHASRGSWHPRPAHQSAPPGWPPLAGRRAQLSRSPHSRLQWHLLETSARTVAPAHAPCPARTTSAAPKRSLWENTAHLRWQRGIRRPSSERSDAAGACAKAAARIQLNWKSGRSIRGAGGRYQIYRLLVGCEAARLRPAAAHMRTTRCIIVQTHIHACEGLRKPHACQGIDHEVNSIISDWGMTFHPPPLACPPSRPARSLCPLPLCVPCVLSCCHTAFLTILPARCAPSHRFAGIQMRYKTGTKFTVLHCEVRPVWHYSCNDSPLRVHSWCELASVSLFPYVCVMRCALCLF